MAALTFKQLQDETLHDDLDDLTYRPKARRYLNDAINELCRRVGWLKRYEIAAYDATGVVALTQPMYEINEAWQAGGPATTDPTTVANQSVFRLSPLPYQSASNLPITGGSPMYYQAEQGAGATDGSPAATVRVWPHQASGFIAVIGRGRPAVMAADTAVSGLGQEYDDILIAYAQSRCFRQQKDFEVAQVLMADFDRGIKEASMSRRPAQDGPLVVGGTWDDDETGRGGW